MKDYMSRILYNCYKISKQIKILEYLNKGYSGQQLNYLLKIKRIRIVRNYLKSINRRSL